MQVGKSDSGKTGIIKTLASIAEKPLHILPVTSAMDTTDILGGFEQVGFFKKFLWYITNYLRGAFT